MTVGSERGPDGEPLRLRVRWGEVRVCEATAAVMMVSLNEGMRWYSVVEIGIRSKSRQRVNGVVR